jgi:hypothetical protein
MIELDDLERRLRAPRSDAPEPPDLVTAAAAAGLLDVAYATLDSPVGSLLLAATPEGLVRLAYLDDGRQDAVLADLARRVSPRMLAAPGGASSTSTSPAAATASISRWTGG